MKVCMFTNTYLPHVGGVARSVDTLAGDLRAHGHQVLIVAPTFAGGELCAEKEQYVIRVPAIQNFNGSDFSVRLPLPFQLTDTLDDYKPQLVHSHHPFLLGDTAVRIARRYKVPLVFTQHTLYEKYTHYVPFDSPALQHFIIHLSTEYANLGQSIVAPSKSIADLIKKRGVSKPITVIPTGVDLNFFASGNGARCRMLYGLQDSHCVIGHLGRLAPEKNLVFLAQAIALVLSGMANSRCILAGEGPVKEVLHAIFARRGLNDRVIFTGNCTGQALSDVYRAMDLFVFASKSETQGMVLTEAMAAQVPVVALDAPGVREVVREGVNGRLLKEDTSSEEFARVIKEEIESGPAPRQHKKLAAFATASAFSRETCVSQMLDLYRDACTETMSEPVAEEPVQAVDVLSNRIKTEWELITQKAAAAVKTMTNA
jgi:1,2-diacylglycerol 3-alpha-glucosyltransferase